MAPTAAERQALQARREDLMDALAPGNPEAIAQEVRLLKAGFSSFGLDQASAQIQVAIYVEALEAFPVWAAKEARARFRDGRNETPWNARECPSSAQMAHECRAIISPAQDEIRPLADVLDAEIVPEANPDMQKRLSAVLQWEQEIRPAMKAKGEVKPKESPEEALERLKAKAAEPVVIGAELGKFLEAMKPKGKAA